jgi:hypothetical protein
VRSLVVALTPLGLLSYWGWLRWSGRISVVEAYRLYQGMTMVPPWTGLAEALRLIVTERDVLLTIKLGVLILVAVTILRRRVPDEVRNELRSGVRIDDPSPLRIEDKVFALAVILQMLMYTGRPLLGAMRYTLTLYPAFLAWGTYAARWNWKWFSIYAGALAALNLGWMWAFLRWSLVL